MKVVTLSTMQRKNGSEMILLIASFLSTAILCSSRCVIRHEEECGTGDCVCIEGEKLRNCFRDTIIPCDHGKCTSNSCECFPCYAGESCNVTVNKYQPVFTQKEYNVYLDPNTETLITHVRARDHDHVEQSCSDVTECPCGNVIYAIESGNEDALFTINQNTGDITYNTDNQIRFTNRFHLIISARNGFKANEDNFAKSTFTELFIFMEESRKSLYGISSSNSKFSHNSIHLSETPLALERVETHSPHHHRYRRSTNLATDKNLTFSLVKVGPFANESEARIGDRIPFNLSIVAPRSSMTDLQVEMYAPKASGPVMLVCAPSVVYVGSNFHALTPSQVVSDMQSQAGDKKYDRAVLEFGTLINNGSGTNEADSTIVVEFAVIVTDNAAFVNGAKFSVSTGAQYSDKKKVWVGQAQFVAYRNDSHENLTSSSSPSFSVKGPDSLQKGLKGVWTVSMTLRDAVNSVVLDVYGPDGSVDIVSFCSMSVVSTGSSYSCYASERAVQTLTKRSNSSENYIIGTLDLGKVINTGYRQSNNVEADNTITIDVVTTLLNTSDVTVGQTYKLGFAAEIDEQSIWTSQTQVTALEQDLDNNTDTLPVFKLSSTYDEVTPGGMTSLLLNMSLPEKSSQIYFLEAVLPANYTNMFEACKVSVKYVGFNYPCLKEITPIFQESKDYVQIDFGLITNTGQKHSSADSIITVEFVLQMREDAVITNDQLLWPTVGVRYGQDLHWVGQLQLTAKKSPSQLSNIKEPEFTLKNVMKDDRIYEGGSSAFYLDIFLPPPSFQEKIDITFTNPIVNDSAVLKFCRIELVHVGKDFGCYNASDVTVNLQKTALHGADDDYTSGSVSLEMISNVGFRGQTWNRNDSVLRFEVVVALSEVLDMGNFSTYETSVGVSYKKVGSTGSWSAKGSLECYPRAVVELGEFDASPSFELHDPQSTSFYPGQPAVMYLDMVLPPRSMATYGVEALVNDTAITVCRIAPYRSGRNIPCYSEESETMYVAYEGDVHHDRASRDMGILSNIGQLPIADDTKGEHTMKTQVVAMVRWDASGTAKNGVSYKMAASVQTGESRVWIGETSIKANTGTAPQQSSTPVVKMRKANNETSLTKGGAAVIFLDIYIPVNSFENYVIEFDAPVNSSDVGKLSICDARVTSAGWNIPCINDTYMEHTYTADSGNASYTKARINAGVIGNIGAPGTATEDAYNLVTAELTVEVLANSSASAGDILYIGASVLKNGNSVFRGQLSYPVSESIHASEASPNVTSLVVVAPQEDWTNETIYNATLRIAETKTWMVNVSVPEMTSNFNMFIKAPSSGGESLMTISNIRFCGWNLNLPCGRNKEPVVNISSSLGTSQNESGVAVLGTISNIGISNRNQWLVKKDYDDIFSVCFDMQATDHKNNLNGTMNELSVDLSYSNNRKLSAKSNATILIYENEYPDVQASVTTEEIPTSGFKPLETLMVTVRLRHTSNSTAHAYNVSVNFLLPSYVEYQGQVENYPEWSVPKVIQVDNSTATSFVYPVLFFSDEITFSFNVTFDPKRSVAPSSSLIHGAISHEVTYDHSSLKVTAGTPTSALLYRVAEGIVEFDLFVAECRDALGVESGEIADCQITASSHYSTNTATKARLNSNSAWTSANRGKPFYQNEYLQVNLGNNTRVTGFTIQGSAHRLITSFRLQYSDDGINWFDYQEALTTKTRIFAMRSNDTDVYMWVPLADDPLITRYVRVLPNSNNRNDYYMSLRLEIHGCAVSSDVSVSEVCANEDPLPALPYYEVGYLVHPTTGMVYACMIQNIDEIPSCSYSEDNGTTWTELEEDITNIHFLRLDTGALYGVVENRRSLVMYNDTTATWSAVEKPEYDLAKSNASQVVEVKQISFDDIETKSWDTLVTEFGFTSNPNDDELTWCGEMDGLAVKSVAANTTTVVGYWGEVPWSS